MLLYEYVNELLSKYPNKRVIQFEFEHKSYVLKQPERITGILRWLKGCPQKAFKREVVRLKELILQKAPIPRIYLINPQCIVMEDCGRTVRSWLEADISEEKKYQILADAAKTLAKLHDKNIVHGRPLLKDILWQEGKVTFIDFEVTSHSKNLTYNKVRDDLLFIYGICREQVSIKQTEKILETFSRYENNEILCKMLCLIEKYRFIYYLLLPFKLVAKTDLMGVYALFEILSTKII